DRCLDATLPGFAHDRAQLGVNLGTALTNRKIPPDSAMRLDGAAIVLDQVAERVRGLRVAAGAREGFRVEAIERLAANALDRGDVEHFPGQRDEELAIMRHGEAVRDRLIGERRGEEKRPVGLLAPEEAPDVVGHPGPLIEETEETLQRPDPLRHRSIDLAEHGGAASAVLNNAGREVVRAEIDETADGPLRTNDFGYIQLVEPILHRDDVPAGSEVRRDRLHRSPGVLCLDAEQDPVVLTAKV